MSDKELPSDRKAEPDYPNVEARQAILIARQKRKMARSAHAYVRGNTLKFYEWLTVSGRTKIPEGPPIWICGDCHVGNLGPVANAQGHVAIQIRDLDQTVIGNPAHDIIRLALSLAIAARGSDLPGVTTAKMLEQIIEGYEDALRPGAVPAQDDDNLPEAVRLILKQASRRQWKHLAKERIKDIKPNIPMGKRFWPLSERERGEINRIVQTDAMRGLLTSLKSRDANDKLEVLDAAYWVKGCSSLGRLRCAVLIGIEGRDGSTDCLIDIKEAIRPSAPFYAEAAMPSDNGERIVEGAKHISPYLGDRMLAANIGKRSVFVRELLPQDMKLEMDRLTREEASKAARFLAYIVGQAHARQMTAGVKRDWLADLKRNRSKNLEAPSWLWSSVVELIVSHEAAYLEHCRRYAMVEAV